MSGSQSTIGIRVNTTNTPTQSYIMGKPSLPGVCQDRNTLAGLNSKENRSLLVSKKWAGGRVVQTEVVVLC